MPSIQISTTSLPQCQAGFSWYTYGQRCSLKLFEEWWIWVWYLNPQETSHPNSWPNLHQILVLTPFFACWTWRNILYSKKAAIFFRFLFVICWRSISLEGENFSFRSFCGERKLMSAPWKSHKVVSSRRSRILRGNVSLRQEPTMWYLEGGCDMMDGNEHISSLILHSCELLGGRVITIGVVCGVRNHFLEGFWRKSFVNLGRITNKGF